MRRIKFWIGGAVAMLLLSVSAVALAGQGASTATPTATFSADAKKVDTRTCQGSDGKYTITRGMYVGTMSSNDTPSLNGDARLIVRSVYNNDESAGWMTGELQVRTAAKDGGVRARFDAVNLDGNVEGLLTGKAGPPRANLLGNFSATFDGSTTGGFSAGKVGTGASGNEALLYTGGCTPDNPPGKNGNGSSPQNQNQNQNAPKDGGRHK